MDELRRQSVCVDIQAGHCLFADLPIPKDLVEVVREWQKLAWFIIDDSPSVCVQNIGVKPGDPAADVLFAFAFYGFHRRLLAALDDVQLLQSVRVGWVASFQMTPKSAMCPSVLHRIWTT
jgi:hypothetical protein